MEYLISSVKRWAIQSCAWVVVAVYSIFLDMPGIWEDYEERKANQRRKEDIFG